MIDTVYITVPYSGHKHLFDHLRPESQYKVLTPTNNEGVLDLDLREYKYGAKEIVYSRWYISNNFGYKFPVRSNEYEITLQVSLPKFFHSTSYLNECTIEHLNRFIKIFRLKYWRIQRIDLCTNMYFQSSYDADVYLNMIQFNHGSKANRTYKTGMVEYNKSSYQVMYRKDKDPKDLLLEIPIMRFETKITPRNTYDFRKENGIGEINKFTIHDLLLYGQKKHEKFITKYLLKEVPKKWLTKDATRLQRQMHKILSLYGSYKQAELENVISKRTRERYESTKFNTCSEVPKFYLSIPTLSKLSLFSYLRNKNLFTPYILNI
jgi:hypothetical protein